MLRSTLRQDADAWLSPRGPKDHVALSSRARYARNIASHRFSYHAPSDVLRRVVDTVLAAVMDIPEFAGYEWVPIAELSGCERNYLRESRLISPEMEKAGENRAVMISPDRVSAILINEEDHLRVQFLGAGFRIAETYRGLYRMETLLCERLRFAFSEKLGFLTACPTNTGTGLRMSVMLHLPALTLLKKVEALLQGLAPYGLTVRGFYGENSEFQGDFYQLSNEFTLGKSEETICDILERVVEQVIEREELARAEFFSRRRLGAEDLLWRSFGQLAHARLISTQEAMGHLSRLRFGIDGGYLPGLTHAELNRLVFETQPAHLQVRHAESTSADWPTEQRDEMRARLLRERMAKALGN